jgi:hypothetical protein
MSDNGTRYVMQLDEGVWKAARGAVMADEISIRVRGEQDSIEFHSLPHESGRMYNPGPTLEKRGWRLVSEVEYIAGRRVWAFVERIEEQPKTEPRYVVLNAGYVFIVRDTTTDLDVATKSSRSGAQHIADSLADGTMALDSLGRAVAAQAAIEDPLAAVDFGEPRCVHGYVERPADRGNAIKACERKAPAVSVGVFSDEGCAVFFDCAVQASDEAARLNAEEEATADAPMYRWAVLCADHEEQPKDACEDCNAELNDDKE